MNVNKIPPLACPQCKSSKVKPGFNKQTKNANGKVTYARDGKIYCYDCKTVTLATGKTEKLKPEWEAHNFPAGP